MVYPFLYTLQLLFIDFPIEQRYRLFIFSRATLSNAVFCSSSNSSTICSPSCSSVSSSWVAPESFSFDNRYSIFSGTRLSADNHSTHQDLSPKRTGEPGQIAPRHPFLLLGKLIENLPLLYRLAFGIICVGRHHHDDAGDNRQAYRRAIGPVCDCGYSHLLIPSATDNK
jgi:hypothetical protein